MANAKPIALKKGESYELKETKVCVSIGSSFSGDMPTMCALDKDGKLLYLKTAPKLGGGDIGREKWNQNAFRDEQVCACLACLLALRTQLLFFEIFACCVQKTKKKKKKGFYRSELARGKLWRFV